jgi:2-polyprenyl-3-methyl-5-hydroxy-6-metoxy-1,4-benzoquinol methylase
MPYLHGGRALDVGCGQGRNALYLSQQGFEVDAWDVNPQSLQKLQQIIDAEGIQKIHVKQRDLNTDPSITGKYDFICCTVDDVLASANGETIDCADAASHKCKWVEFDCVCHGYR